MRLLQHSGLVDPTRHVVMAFIVMACVVAWWIRRDWPHTGGCRPCLPAHLTNSSTPRSAPLSRLSIGISAAHVWHRGLHTIPWRFVCQQLNLPIGSVCVCLGGDKVVSPPMLFLVQRSASHRQFSLCNSIEVSQTEPTTSFFSGHIVNLMTLAVEPCMWSVVQCPAIIDSRM